MCARAFAAIPGCLLQLQVLQRSLLHGLTVCCCWRSPPRPLPARAAGQTHCILASDGVPLVPCRRCDTAPGGGLCVCGPVLQYQVVCCNCRCCKGPCCTDWLSAAAGVRLRGFSRHGLQDRHLVFWRAMACHSSLAEAATLPPRPPGIEAMVRLPDRIHVLWRVMACLSSLAAAATLPPRRPGIGALV